LRGLRLTEGTDAVLQCNVIGVPKPKVKEGKIKNWTIICKISIIDLLASKWTPIGTNNTLSNPLWRHSGTVENFNDGTRR
jgi:hypothetical protein